MTRDTGKRFLERILDPQVSFEIHPPQWVTEWNTGKGSIASLGHRHGILVDIEGLAVGFLLTLRDGRALVIWHDREFRQPWTVKQ